MQMFFLKKRQSSAVVFTFMPLVFFFKPYFC